MTPHRNRHRRGLVAASLTAMIVLAAAACGGSDTEAPPSGSGSASSEQGELLTVAKDTKPNSLNPAKANSHPNEWDDIALAYAPLLHINPDLSYSPGLAESWELDDENKNVTFTLRPDLKFADGTPLTAKEAVASIQYWLDTSPASVSFASAVTGVEATDDLTFVVEQSGPNPSILRVFSENFYGGSIISPAGLADPQKLETGSFGAGPYVLDTDATVPGSQYAYVPNPEYFDTSAQHFKNIVLKIVPAGAPQVQALQAGDVDLISVDGSNFTEVEAAGVLMSSGAPLAEFGVLLADRDGELNPAIGNADVRRALIIGVDTAAVCQAVFGDTAVPSANWPVIDAQDPSLDEMYPYDEAKAKELLDGAGYGDGFTVNLEMTASPPIFSGIGQAVAGYWKDLGVDVQITQSPEGVDSQTAQTEKKFETYAYGYGLLPAQLTASSFLTPTGPGPFDPWETKNQEIEDLVASAPTLPEAESIAAYQEAFKIASEDGWALNACQLQSIYAANEKITGWQVDDAAIPPYVTAIAPTD